jgi:hypothetical protein
MAASLAGTLGRVVRLRLGEIAVGILHEIRLSLLVAEAVCLALEGRIHGTLRFDVLVQSEALRTHVVELALRGGKRCRG